MQADSHILHKTPHCSLPCSAGGAAVSAGCLLFHSLNPTPLALQVLTNDILKAALHRVRSPHTQPRYSAPFFFNPGGAPGLGALCWARWLRRVEAAGGRGTRPVLRMESGAGEPGVQSSAAWRLAADRSRLGVFPFSKWRLASVVLRCSPHCSGCDHCAAPRLRGIEPAGGIQAHQLAGIPGGAVCG